MRTSWALLILAIASHAAETNHVTLTNLAGVVYSDICIIRAQPNGLLWKNGSNGLSGGLLHIRSLRPEDVQRYGLREEDADQFDTKQRDAKAEYKAWVAAEERRLAQEQAVSIAYKKSKAAFLAQCQWVEGRVVQRADGIVHLMVEVMPATTYRYSYGVARSSAVNQRQAVKGYPGYGSLKSDQQIALWAVRSGKYSYTSIVGDAMSIDLFDASIPDEFAHDKEVLSKLGR